METTLTTREMNVLFLLSQGKKNIEIANTLHISIHTTKSHLETIYGKLEVKNRVQAAIKAVFLNLIDINTIV